MAVTAKVSLAVSALWMGFLGAFAAPAEAALATHRAIYDLVLKRAEERSGLTGAAGRMVIELSGSECEGWTVGFRVINQFTLSTGGTRLVDSRSTSWEAGDGSSMRYVQHQYVDNKLDNEVTVNARHGLGDAPGKGEITKPKNEAFTFTSAAIFPVAHQKRLIAAARDGQQRDEVTIYDGSDGVKTYLAISFIGARQEPQELPGGVSGNAAKVLSGLPSWPVSLSYFPGTRMQGDETPSHQINFRMYENGIAGDLVLDYGEFVLDGKLSSVDLIEPRTCP